MTSGRVGAVDKVVENLMNPQRKNGEKISVNKKRAILDSIMHIQPALACVLSLMRSLTRDSAFPLPPVRISIFA